VDSAANMISSRDRSWVSDPEFRAVSLLISRMRHGMLAVPVHGGNGGVSRFGSRRNEMRKKQPMRSSLP
jgi:hypothetical protein